MLMGAIIALAAAIFFGVVSALAYQAARREQKGIIASFFLGISTGLGWLIAVVVGLCLIIVLLWPIAVRR